MKNNKGFSLVELIVVVAILGVMSTMSVVGFNSFSSVQVKQPTQIIETYLSADKIKSVSGQRCVSKIYCDDDWYYISRYLYNSDTGLFDIKEETNQLMSTKATLSIREYSDTNVVKAEKVVRKDDEILFRFSPVTANFQYCTLNDTNIFEDYGYAEIVLTNGRTSYSIYLVESTGHHDSSLNNA